MNEYQPLSADQRRQLAAQGCTADDWDRILVTEDFSPARIAHCGFGGEVRIAGEVTLRNVGTLANCDIRRGARIEQTAVVETVGRSSFGCGTPVAVIDFRRWGFGWGDSGIEEEIPQTGNDAIDRPIEEYVAECEELFDRYVTLDYWKNITLKQYQYVPEQMAEVIRLVNPDYRGAMPHLTTASYQCSPLPKTPRAAFLWNTARAATRRSSSTAT